MQGIERNTAASQPIVVAAWNNSRLPAVVLGPSDKPNPFLVHSVRLDWPRCMRAQLAKLIVNSGGAAALVDYVADAQARTQPDSALMGPNCSALFESARSRNPTKFAHVFLSRLRVSAMFEPD